MTVLTITLMLDQHSRKALYKDRCCFVSFLPLCVFKWTHMKNRAIAEIRYRMQAGLRWWKSLEKETWTNPKSVFTHQQELQRLEQPEQVLDLFFWPIDQSLILIRSDHLSRSEWILLPPSWSPVCPAATLNISSIKAKFPIMSTWLPLSVPRPSKKFAGGEWSYSFTKVGLPAGLKRVLPCHSLAHANPELKTGTVSSPSTNWTPPFRHPSESPCAFPSIRNGM